MSTREYGCFFCAGKSTQPNDICTSCGESINIKDDLLDNDINEYHPEDVLGRGYYGWTLYCKESYQHFALKLIPTHKLGSAEFSENEARALAACSPHRNIANFVRHFYVKLTVRGHSVEVLGLVFEYIPNADPLSIFLDSTVELSRADVRDILVGIASGIARMHSKGIWHDDLHDDNVLIRRIGEDENLPERYEAKLIDFGSTKPLSPTQQESAERGDYYYLGKHIDTLTRRFEGNIKRLTPVDRAFAGRLRLLAQRISDRDVSRRSMSPNDIIAEIKKIYDECAKSYVQFPTFDDMKRQSSVSLTEPLENTNALNLEPQDVALLFRDSLRWQSRLEKSESVIVVGPRGCGKTMLLRYLSTESQARPRANESTADQVRERLENGTYVGFLVSSGQLRTPFLRSAYKRLEGTDPDRAEEFCREFISSVFVLEVLRTVLWLNAEHLANISISDLGILYSAVADLLIGVQSLRLRQTGRLEELVELIERHIGHLSNLKHPDEYSPSNVSRDDTLDKLARALRTSSWIADRQIWFLLDDYSVTVLPPFVQSSYNPVLFNVPSTFRLKVSSEGDGPVLMDRLNRKYKEGREISKLNLGEVYFAATEDEGKAFFEQILEARFTAVKKGSLGQLKHLLAEHPNLQGFGKYIRGRSKAGDARFYGFGLLCRLCSGDVSFIIELLHILTQGRWDDNVKSIPPLEQDQIIKHFAQRQLADLRRISDHGSMLYEFAEGVGNLLKRYLLDSKGKSDERLRIEIEGSEPLSAEAQNMHEALLRHTVLIDGGVGKSRKGLPTRKLFFRRLFAPCFPFSPTRKGCVALTVRQYETWLRRPNKIGSYRGYSEENTLPLE